MNRILPLSLLGGVLFIILTAAALSLILPRLAAAQGESAAGVWPDSNGNGVVDRSEVINVIRLYFSGGPIPASPAGGDKWVRNPVTSTVDGLGLVNSVEDGPNYGPWYLSLSCSSAGNPGVFIRNIRHLIYSSDWGESREMSLRTVVGNVTQPDAWFYFPPEDDWADYFSYRFGETLISAMLDADEMTVVTPYDISSTVTFPIGGLSEHIDEPSDICTRLERPGDGTQPADGVPVATALAPLGSSLLGIWHIDVTQSPAVWSVYDPNGTFSPSQILLHPGSDPPDPSSIELLTHLVPGKIYSLISSEEQTVTLSGVELTLYVGSNAIVFGDSFFGIVEATEPVVSDSAEVFSSLSDRLLRVWYLDRATQAWSFYDPDPAFADFNALTEVSSGQIVIIIISDGDSIEFNSSPSTLYQGANIVALSAPSSDAAVSVSPAAVPQGGSITIGGWGFPSNTTIDAVRLDGNALVDPSSVQTDGGGRFSIQAVVPSNLPPGTYTIRVTVGSITVDVFVEVVDRR